jgi:hypothetical protein
MAQSSKLAQSFFCAVFIRMRHFRSKWRILIKWRNPTRIHLAPFFLFSHFYSYVMIHQRVNKIDDTLVPVFGIHCNNVFYLGACILLYSTESS